MSASAVPLRAGARVGDYELVRRIGRGGMAEVWCARRKSERRASKFVAIKLVADQYVGNPRYQRMFRSEAELSGLLNHTNIVQVFGEGQDAGRSYLVMEWIDGVNLLKIGAALTFIEDQQWKLKIVCYIIGQLLYALGYAHSITMHDGDPLGIVHRDVSPQNVLISNNGEVKLTDFGVAHYLLEESSGVHVKGKVRYMAPEQLGGKTRDPRLDLYAVGAILHELVDGRRFRHHVEDQRQMYLEVLSGKVPALTVAIPPELDALRRGLLQADPADRIPSADAAMELLETYPGYGDARRDLTQLCGGLTGVLRPRVGPGSSKMHPSASPHAAAAPRPGAAPPAAPHRPAAAHHPAATHSPAAAPHPTATPYTAAAPHPAAPPPVMAALHQTAAGYGTTPEPNRPADDDDSPEAEPATTVRITRDAATRSTDSPPRLDPTDRTRTPITLQGPAPHATEAPMVPSTAVMSPSTVHRVLDGRFESGPIGLQFEGTEPQREISTVTSMPRPGAAPSAAPSLASPSRRTLIVVMLAGVLVASLGIFGALMVRNGMSGPETSAVGLRRPASGDASDAAAPPAEEPGSTPPERLAAAAGSGSARDEGTRGGPGGESSGQPAAEPATSDPGGGGALEPVAGRGGLSDGSDDDARSDTPEDPGVVVDDGAPPRPAAADDTPADPPPARTGSAPARPRPRPKPRPTAPFSIATEKALGPVEVKVGRKIYTIGSTGYLGGRIPVGTYRARWRPKGASDWSKSRSVGIHKASCELRLVIRASTGLQDKTSASCK